MKLAMLLVAFLFMTFAVGQSVPSTASWNGLEMVQFMSQCQLHGSDSVKCIATDGEEYSYQGGAWHVLTGSVGPAGPQGPQGVPGPAGATGPQGPAGPAATNPVTSVNGKTGAVVLQIQ